MKQIHKLTKFFKQLKLNQIATAFLLATVLIVTTACNNGDELGARPNVSPVQLGGQNNPHKAGGDGMAQYKSPVNDSRLNKDKDRASLPGTNYLAAANKSETTYPTDDKHVEGLLYSDNKAESLDSKNDFNSPKNRQELLDPTQIPAKQQTNIDRSDPDNKLLEKVGQMFDDAADFSPN
ncbi:MAG TPA: DUF6658 family protein [Coleofasciculaceae cyanobacterium]